MKRHTMKRFLSILLAICLCPLSLFLNACGKTPTESTVETTEQAIDEPSEPQINGKNASIALSEAFARIFGMIDGQIVGESTLGVDISDYSVSGEISTLAAASDGNAYLKSSVLLTTVLAMFGGSFPLSVMSSVEGWLDGEYLYIYASSFSGEVQKIKIPLYLINEMTRAFSLSGTGFPSVDIPEAYAELIARLGAAVADFVNRMKERTEMISRPASGDVTELVIEFSGNAFLNEFFRILAEIAYIVADYAETHLIYNDYDEWEDDGDIYYYEPDGEPYTGELEEDQNDGDLDDEYFDDEWDDDEWDDDEWDDDEWEDDVYYPGFDLIDPNLVLGLLQFIDFSRIFEENELTLTFVFSGDGRITDIKVDFVLSSTEALAELLSSSMKTGIAALSKLMKSLEGTKTDVDMSFRLVYSGSFKIDYSAGQTAVPEIRGDADSYGEIDIMSYIPYLMY